MPKIDEIRRTNEKLEEEFKKIQEGDVQSQEDTQAQQEDKPEEKMEGQAEVKEEQQNPEEKQEEEKWEHKYKVLQGKYNAEVPRMADEIRLLKEENEFLKGKLELLEKVVIDKAQPQKKVEEPDLDSDPDIKTLKEEFPEIYKAIGKLLEKYGSKFVPKEEIHEVKQHVERVSTLSFYDRLASLVPDWQTINVDPEFLDWLKEIDDYSGTPKLYLLRKAFEEGDANRVAKFFNKFKESKIPSNNGQQQKTIPESTIAPPKGKTISSSNVGAKPVYSKSQIEKFYLDLALGRIPKEEAQKTERELVVALKEGRVID